MHGYLKCQTQEYVIDLYEKTLDLHLDNLF